MIKFKGPFASAALFVTISAVLHILAFIVGGFNGDAVQMMIIGIVAFIIAMGLNQGWRWLGYLSFIAAAVGGIVAIYYAFGGSSIPGWWFVLIAAVDFIVVILLFLALWKDPQPNA